MLSKRVQSKAQIKKHIHNTIHFCGIGWHVAGLCENCRILQNFANIVVGFVKIARKFPEFNKYHCLKDGAGAGTNLTLFGVVGYFEPFGFYSKQLWAASVD